MPRGRLNRKRSIRRYFDESGASRKQRSTKKVRYFKEPVGPGKQRYLKIRYFKEHVRPGKQRYLKIGYFNELGAPRKQIRT